MIGPCVSGMPVVFLNLRPKQRVLRLHGRVVNADALAFDVLVDDRQQGRLLPGQVDGPVDHVLVVIAERAERSRRSARWAQVAGSALSFVATRRRRIVARSSLHVRQFSRAAVDGHRWRIAQLCSAAGALPIASADPLLACRLAFLDRFVRVSCIVGLVFIAPL